MTHQTGILPNEELTKFMKKTKESSKTRIFKVSIKNEQLVLDGHEQSDGKFDSDFTCLVKKMVLDQQPCYLLMRLDGKNSSKLYDWHLILWSPELSPVREKMLYASTKAALKKEFGSANITLDYFATCHDDLTLDSYSMFVERKRKEENGEHDLELLTSKEQDLKLVKKEEAELSSSTTKPTKTLPGVEFPLTTAAMTALQDLKDGVLSYLQLKIHSKEEVIDLVRRENHKEFDVSDLPSKVPTESPRYHLFLLPHNHEGLYYKSTVFVYSVVGSGCSVRERMLYSSCKNSLMMVLKDRVGISLDKKIESDDPSELTLDFLMDQLHPKQHENGDPKKSFEKPAGPSGKRGFRRLIKSGD